MEIYLSINQIDPASLHPSISQNWSVKDFLSPGNGNKGNEVNIRKLYGCLVSLELNKSYSLGAEETADVPGKQTPDLCVVLFKARSK